MTRELNWWFKRTQIEIKLIILTTVLSIALVYSIFLLISRENGFSQNQSENIEELPELTKTSEPTTSELRINRGVSNHKSGKQEAGNRSKICVSAGCVQAASRILDKLDNSVEPCDDFYHFACGRFIKETIVPDDKTSISAISLLADKVKEQLRVVLEEPRSSSELKPYRLAKDLFSACMNKSAIENRGIQPILDVLERLGGWPVLQGEDWKDEKWNWTENAYKLRELGFSADNFFDFSVDADYQNSSQRVIRVGQATLSLGREYLIKSFDYKTVQAYYQYQVDTAVVLGAERSKAEKEMKVATLFEMKIANISLPSNQIRNASKLFNPMTITELQSRFPNIPWLQYFNQMMPSSIKLDDTERIVVDVLTYVKQLEILLNTTPKRVLANYAIWRAVSSIMSYAPEVMRNAELKSSGKAEREPRWKECVDIVNSKLHQAVGSLYVQNFIKDEAKVNAQAMVDGIRAEFMKILNKLSWMDDETRFQATEKAKTMVAHIAYPEELLNSSALETYYVDLQINKNLYLESMLNISRFAADKSFAKLRLNDFKHDWTMRHTSVVNAYYSKAENSIQLPVGILQVPFFSNERPKYLNYGAVGFVIGHEITHGFDDQGRQFDKNGHLVDWWAKNTEKKFLKKAQCIIEQYGNYTVKEVGLKINGVNTQGENIADNGGIKMAYKAYIEWSKHNGVEASLPGLQFSPRQLFWISAANIWCAKYRPEALKLKVVTDVHATKMFRVIGSFSNIDDFSKDFKCPIGSKMNPAKKCIVW